MPSIAFTQRGRAQKQLAAALAAAESAFKQSIHLTVDREQYLAGLASKHLHPPGFYHVQQLPELHVKASNLSAELSTCLLAAGLAGAIKWRVCYGQQQQQHQEQQQSQPEQQQLSEEPAAATGQDKDDYLALLNACKLPPDCNLLLIELQAGAKALTYAEQCAAAFALLSCVPVAFVAQDWCPAVNEAANSPAGRVWGVCSSYFELEERLRGDLQRGDLHRAAVLREVLLADINSRVAPFREVDTALHFAKRGALALVPFGVHATNALGLLRLARRVLQVTGMGSSRQAKRSVASEAGTGGVKVTAFECVGEVYGLIVQGSIAGEALAAAVTASSVAAGAVAAIDTVSLLDAFTLGSVCVVTGMLSAWGAAVCRPATVDGMARAIAAQQLAAAVQPEMRVVTCSRVDSSSSSSSSCGGGVSNIGGSSCSSVSRRGSSRRVTLIDTSHDL